MPETHDYPARLGIDYPEEHDRIRVLFRIIIAIPIIALLLILTTRFAREDTVSISTGLFLATILMIVVRQRYPRWWFDFVLELARFTCRIAAYMFLMTDKYPSTEEEQTCHLELDYPDVPNDLNRWLPLVKWVLSLPHFIVLIFLSIGVLGAVIVAWISILLTQTYPRVLFDYVEGVMRWWTRYAAYTFWLVTDRYPPFSLNE